MGIYAQYAGMMTSLMTWSLQLRMAVFIYLAIVALNSDACSPIHSSFLELKQILNLLGYLLGYTSIRILRDVFGYTFT